MVWDAREVNGEWWSRNRATPASGFVKSLRILGVANNTTVCGRIVRGTSSGAEQAWSTTAAPAQRMARQRGMFRIMRRLRGSDPQTIVKLGWARIILNTRISNTARGGSMLDIRGAG